MHIDVVLDSPTCPVLLLKDYLNQRKNLSPEQPLFVSGKGLAISSSGISSVVKNMCKAGGFLDKVLGYSLRIVLFCCFDQIIRCCICYN